MPRIEPAATDAPAMEPQPSAAAVMEPQVLVTPTREPGGLDDRPSDDPPWTPRSP